MDHQNEECLWGFLIVCVMGKVCMLSFFGLVSLIGCIDDKEKEPFGPKTSPFKGLYAFLQKN